MPITVDWICQYLEDFGGINDESVCDYLCDKDDTCLENCEMSYPKAKCYLRYFEYIKEKENESNRR